MSSSSGWSSQRRQRPTSWIPRSASTWSSQLVTAAEISRCRNDPDEMERWERVIRVCRSTGIRWEEACALRRLAEAAIRRNASRQLIAATLRRLHELATDMGAHPLREQAERLARVARVNLDHPQVIPAQTVPPFRRDPAGGRSHGPRARDPRPSGRGAHQHGDRQPLW